MFQPLYTMHRFNWHDARGAEGLGYIKALRTMLTNYLPSLMPDLNRWTASALDGLMAPYKKSDGTIVAPAAQVLRKAIIMMNANTFFGEELGADQDFVENAHYYTDFVIQGAEFFRLLPEFVKP
jgi:hypothetical protein